MPIREAIRIIDECLESLNYISSVCTLWGISANEMPIQAALGIQLLEKRAYFRQVLAETERQKKRVVLLDETLSDLQKILESMKKNKLSWKNGPIRIVCSDQKLVDFASAVNEGQVLIFKKDEVDVYFDFTSAFPFWKQIPSYTLIIIGGGLAFSSPEYDLFQSMCWCSDEATKTYLRLQEETKNTGNGIFDEESLFEICSIHRMMCMQTVINSFLVLEAYLNSLAHLYLTDSSKSISEEHRLYLCEQVKDERGSLHQKFVPIKDKLFKWVKIMSPRGETFDRGKKPFQEFMELKGYRDSIVHLSEDKVPTYNSIDFDVCRRAVSVTIEIVEAIGLYIASDRDDPQPAWWLRYPGSDGFFHLSLGFYKFDQENNHEPQHSTLP